MQYTRDQSTKPWSQTCRPTLYQVCNFEPCILNQKLVKVQRAYQGSDQARVQQSWVDTKTGHLPQTTTSQGKTGLNLNLIQNVAAPLIWPRKYIFLAKLTLWSGFHGQELNTRGDCQLAPNQAEPENQADMLPDPDPDQNMHHYARSQHAASSYVRE